MTNAQRLTCELSKAKQRLNALSAGETLSEEETTEIETLSASVQQLEPQLRAAIVSEGAETATVETTKPEDREFREILQKASAGSIISCALRNKSTVGPERELQDHYEISANEIPLELLRTPVEHRALTPAPTDVGVQQAEVTQPVFASGDGAFLGARESMLQSGDAVFPVLSTRPVVRGPFKDSTAAANTTGSFGADLLEPSRIQCAFLYRRTDATRFAGMDSALRMALASGLQEGLDKELVDQVVVDVSRTDASAADTFASYRARFVYAQVDGRYATSEADIRMLVGSETLQDMAILYRANSSDDSAVDSIRRVSGGLKVSPHIVAASANKQDVIIRKGMNDDIHIVMWPGVEIIDDQVTAATKGEITLTAVLLAAWKVTRTAGFARIQSQHS